MSILKLAIENTVSSLLGMQAENTQMDGVTIETQDGDDTVIAKGDNNNISVGKDNDVVFVSGENNTVEGEEGNKYSIIKGKNNTVEYNGDGNYTTFIEGDNNSFKGGNGDISASIEGNSNTINSGNGEAALYIKGDSNCLEKGEGNIYAQIEGNANSVKSGEGEAVLAVKGDFNNLQKGNGNITLSVEGSGNAFNSGNGEAALYIKGDSNSLEKGDGNTSAEIEGNSNVINSGNGDVYAKITGSGNNAKFGDGDKTLYLTGDSNTLQTGDGQTYAEIAGNINNVAMGNGDRTVIMNGNSNSMSVGDGDSYVTMQGNSNNLNFGNGNNSIGFIGDNNRVECGDGNNYIAIWGDSNYIKAGDGDNYVTSLDLAMQQGNFSELYNAWANTLPVDYWSDSQTYSQSASSTRKWYETHGGGLFDKKRTYEYWETTTRTVKYKVTNDYKTTSVNGPTNTTIELGNGNNTVAVTGGATVKAGVKTTVKDCPKWSWTEFLGSSTKVVSDKTTVTSGRTQLSKGTWYQAVLSPITACVAAAGSIDKAITGKDHITRAVANTVGVVAGNDTAKSIKNDVKIMQEDKHFREIMKAGTTVAAVVAAALITVFTCGAGAPLGAMIVGGAIAGCAAGAIQTVGTAAAYNQKMNWRDFAASTAGGAAGGAVGGAVASGVGALASAAGAGSGAAAGAGAGAAASAGSGAAAGAGAGAAASAGAGAAASAGAGASTTASIATRAAQLSSAIWTGTATGNITQQVVQLEDVSWSKARNAATDAATDIETYAMAAVSAGLTETIQYGGGLGKFAYNTANAFTFGGLDTAVNTYTTARAENDSSMVGAAFKAAGAVIDSATGIVTIYDNVFGGYSAEECKQQKLVENATKKYEEAKAEFEATKAEYEIAESEFDNARNDYNQAKAKLNKSQSDYEQAFEYESTALERAQYSENETEIADYYEKLMTFDAELGEAQLNYENKEAIYNSARDKYVSSTLKQVDSKINYENAQTALTQARNNETYGTDWTGHYNEYRDQGYGRLTAATKATFNGTLVNKPLTFVAGTVDATFNLANDVMGITTGYKFNTGYGATGTFTDYNPNNLAQYTWDGIKALGKGTLWVANKAVGAVTGAEIYSDGKWFKSTPYNVWNLANKAIGFTTGIQPYGENGKLFTTAENSIPQYINDAFGYTTGYKIYDSQNGLFGAKTSGHTLLSDLGITNKPGTVSETNTSNKDKVSGAKIESKNIDAIADDGETFIGTEEEVKAWLKSKNKDAAFTKRDQLQNELNNERAALQQYQLAKDNMLKADALINSSNEKINNLTEQYHNARTAANNQTWYGKINNAIESGINYLNKTFDGSLLSIPVKALTTALKVPGQIIRFATNNNYGWGGDVKYPLQSLGENYNALKAIYEYSGLKTGVELTNDAVGLVFGSKLKLGDSTYNRHWNDVVDSKYSLVKGAKWLGRQFGFGSSNSTELTNEQENEILANRDNIHNQLKTEENYYQKLKEQGFYDIAKEQLKTVNNLRSQYADARTAANNLTWYGKISNGIEAGIKGINSAFEGTIFSPVANIANSVLNLPGSAVRFLTGNNYGWGGNLKYTVDNIGSNYNFAKALYEYTGLRAGVELTNAVVGVATGYKLQLGDQTYTSDWNNLNYVKNSIPNQLNNVIDYLTDGYRINPSTEKGFTTTSQLKSTISKDWDGSWLQRTKNNLLDSIKFSNSSKIAQATALPQETNNAPVVAPSVTPAVTPANTNVQQTLDKSVATTPETIKTVNPFISQIAGLSVAVTKNLEYEIDKKKTVISPVTIDLSKLKLIGA